MAVEKQDNLENLVLTRLMRLNATIHGVVFGILGGGIIFVATNWLLIKGGPVSEEGPVIGPHLYLLSQFFIGYDISFVGSLVGFVYGFVAGFLVGFFIAQVYNWIVGWKEKRQAAQ